MAAIPAMPMLVRVADAGTRGARESYYATIYTSRFGG